jgi:hypothetical protein
LCQAFGVESLEELRVSICGPGCYAVRCTRKSLTYNNAAVQDVFNCMCLSEGVYKVVDYGVDKAAEILAAIMEGFPPGLVNLRRVHWSQAYAQHRFVPLFWCSL